MQTYTIPQGTKELTIETYNDKIVIEFVSEKKKPIFITEDGVNLYGKQDECWYVRLSDNRIGEQPFVHKEMTDHVNFKYFSTRKAAEEYVAKKSWEPKDGDIVFNERNESISIFKETVSNTSTKIYCGINQLQEFYENIKSWSRPTRFATDSEKQLLFDKLAEQGLRWNAEEKKIEKARWRAKHGENYWTFTSTDIFNVSDYGYASDNERYNNGFYFKTEEQAEKARMATINLLLTTEF